jgi:hypothetical protein
VFYINDRLFHMKMAERNEAIMFSAPPTSPNDYTPLHPSAGFALMERVCTSVQCGLVDTLLSQASFVQRCFPQLYRDQFDDNFHSPNASKILSLLARLDLLAQHLDQKKDDRRATAILRCFQQTRATFTAPDQESG